MKKDWICILLGAGAVAAGVAGYLIFKRQSAGNACSEDVGNSQNIFSGPHAISKKCQYARGEILNQRTTAQTVPVADSALKGSISIPCDTPADDTDTSVDSLPVPKLSDSAPDVIPPVDSVIEESAITENSVKDCAGVEDSR